MLEAVLRGLSSGSSPQLLVSPSSICDLRTRTNPPHANAGVRYSSLYYSLSGRHALPIGVGNEAITGMRAIAVESIPVILLRIRA